MLALSNIFTSKSPSELRKNMSTNHDNSLYQGTSEAVYGSAANHYLLALYELAIAKGVNVELILQNLHICKSFLHQPDMRISTEKLAALQKAIWDYLNDESMGATSQPLLSGTYYMMGQLTVQQSTLKKALLLGAKFYNYMLRKQFISIEINAAQTMLKVILEDPKNDYKHLFSEIALLSWHRYASWLIADILPLNETRFPYLAPSHVSEYNYLFPGIHRFSAGELALVFPSHYLEKEVKQDTSSLKAFMKRCPFELFKQYQADYSISSELKLIIKKELHSGIASLEYCASELHMTTRTLTRKLKEEATSYQQIKDVIRRDKAISLLTQKYIAINEVGERIGYSDPAVFSRAFKNWTGKTPRSFRTNFLSK